MLRLSLNQKGFLIPYICCSCWAGLRSVSILTVRPSLRAWRPSNSPVTRSNGLGDRRSFGLTTVNHEIVAETSCDGTKIRPIEITKPPSDIRERLRRWEIENGHDFAAILEPLDLPKPGSISNTPIRQPSGQFRVDSEETDASSVGLGISVFDQHDLVDVGSIRSFLLPGDLVELRQAGSQNVELAIFVRDIERQSQFYTMTGKWVHLVSPNAPFFVPEFVQPSELDEILPYLPKSDVSAEVVDMLQNPALSVPRNVGKNLVLKMLDFWNKADLAYRTAANKLDNAHFILADRSVYTYATLEETAQKLYAGSDQLLRDTLSFRAALYAVHRAILRQSPGFKLKKRGNIRAGGQYEICSLKEIDSLSFVSTAVRNHSQRNNQSAQPSLFEKFITTAQELIDSSRKSREFTPYGMVGPSLVKAGEKYDLQLDMLRKDFLSRYGPYIRFIESWCCLESWDRYSPLSGIGSAILRATGRYEDVVLDNATAWTFLQEIGVIPPWESKVAYDLRIADVGQRLKSENGCPTTGFVKDRMTKLRKDWDKMDVYCIDDTNAHEIDDGISIESTGTTGEYWAHVHTADPAAHIEVGGPAAEYAQKLTNNIYLPERAISMLHPPYVQANLSLAPSRPCLTFSGRLNLDGDLLDTNITSGIVQQVHYLTPETVNAITQASPEVQKTVYTVGKEVPPRPPSRTMLSAYSLSSQQKEQLRLLQTLANARGKKWRARGGISTYNDRSNVDISFNGRPWQPHPANSSNSYNEDPTIRLTVEQPTSNSTFTSSSPLVSTHMLLAGEIAATWCRARGIPIPYRVTAHNPQHTDNLAAYFREHVQPTLDEHGNPPHAVAMEWMRVVGGTQPSTTPGPHAVIGAELMTRCTSPLRRFGDLLVHWQIEAALMEEARRGESLVGNTEEDFLPFGKGKIDSMLVGMDARERAIRAGGRNAVKAWQCILLVRAWKFGEMELPSPLVAEVGDVNVQSGAAHFVLEGLRVPFRYSPPEGERVVKEGEEEGVGKGWRMEQGQRFEVELVDVNVYSREVTVKLLRRLKNGEARESVK